MQDVSDLPDKINNGQIKVGKHGAWSPCALTDIALNGQIATIKLIRFAHDNGNDIVLELDASMFLKMLSIATCDVFIDTILRASSDER